MGNRLTMLGTSLIVVTTCSITILSAPCQAGVGISRVEDSVNSLFLRGRKLNKSNAGSEKPLEEQDLTSSKEAQSQVDSSQLGKEATPKPVAGDSSQNSTQDIGDASASKKTAGTTGTVTPTATTTEPAHITDAAEQRPIQTAVDSDSSTRKTQQPARNPDTAASTAQHPSANAATGTNQKPKPTAKASARKKPKEASLIDLFRMDLTHTDLRTVGDLLVRLRREVTDHPQDPALRIRLGCHLYLAGDYEGAATEMKRAIALQPDGVIGHTLLAKLLDDAGDQSAAHAEFQRAIEIDPTFADARVFFADSLMRHGAVSEAIDEFRRANETRPTPDGLSGLSEALLVVQDHDGAVKAARQAVSVMPNSSKAHVALTRALLATDEKQSALRTARQATLLDPTSADSHIALGRALYANTAVADAVQEFQQAVNLDPLNAQARNDLGYALYGKGDVASAVTQLQLALRLNPHLSEARNNLQIAIFGLSGKSK